MFKNQKIATVVKTFFITFAVIVIIWILWLDASTTIWQERVIFSGLAASIVSFLGTYIVVNLIINRVQEKRWAPVTILALSDFLHSLADEEHSEISKGIVVARTLKIAPLQEINVQNSTAALTAMVKEIHSERVGLTDSLARWSQFLASSGDNDLIMQHVATVSLQLERLRDLIVEFMATDTISQNAYDELTAATNTYNLMVTNLTAEISDRLEDHKQSHPSK